MVSLPWDGPTLLDGCRKSVGIDRLRYESSTSSSLSSTINFLLRFDIAKSQKEITAKPSIHVQKGTTQNPINNNQRRS